MPEPSERNSIRGPYDAIRRIEDQDVHIRELRDLRIRLQDQFANHTAAVQEGNWPAVAEYDLPEYIPFETTTYPVDMTRQGEFVSRHPNQFTHLPSRQEVPGVVKLTLGDLDAAAEWDMLPTLNPDSRKRPQSNHCRQLIEDVKYRAVMRRVFVARLLLAERIWKRATQLADGGAAWPDIPAQYEVEPGQAMTQLTRPQVETALVKPGMLAERVTFSMAARLGSRVAPPFRPFRARAGVDMNEHVDLLMRVEPANAEPTLVGVDITTKQAPEDLWRKYFVQRDSGRSATTGTLRDPATLDYHLRAARSVLATPSGIEWLRVLHKWSDKRAHTTITPEYMLRSDHRIELGERILGYVHTPDGQDYYSPTVIQKTYRSVYGQWDTKHP